MNDNDNEENENNNNNNDNNKSINIPNLNEEQNNLINIIIESHVNANTEKHQISCFELLNEESNEKKMTNNLLEILTNFISCVNNLSSIDNLRIIIYIKNFLLKVKEKPKLSEIENLDKKVLSIIGFYLTFNFNRNNDDFNKIKNFFNEIISSVFDLIILLKEPKIFLQKLYDELFNKYITENISSNEIKASYEELVKFIYLYEMFCKIFLIYTQNYTEMNIIFEKYYLILQIFFKKYSSNKAEDKSEINAKLINQCLSSFSRTTLLSLDAYIKSQFLYIVAENSNNINTNNEKKYKDIFFDNVSFLSMINHIYNIKNNNNNNFSLGIEYGNKNKDNEGHKFEFLTCKGKGLLIEALTIIIKKLSKFGISTFDNFNNLIIILYDNIVKYLIAFYKNGNYPREKADNSQTEIIQLGVILKLISFIEEIIGNMTYSNLIDQNKYKNDILMYIIIPNLLPTDLEKTYFLYDQEEYIKNLLDMSHLCEDKLPKQKCLKLLMTMCDSIDGFFSYIIHVYIYVLKSITLSNRNIVIEDIYKDLCSFLLNNISSFDLIEQSLQVLISVSFLFGEKTNVVDFFNEEIDLINYMLVKIKDSFLKTKLCIFYSYNLEILFHDDDEILSKSFHDSLTFLFDCILNNDSNNSNPSLIKAAFNAINEIIFNNYLKKFCVTQVSIYAIKVINYFNKKENLNGNEEEFNEFLKGVVKEYMYNLGDSAIQLFDLFWDKCKTCLDKTIQNEIEEQHNKSLNKNKESYVLKDKTKEVNEAVELSTQINIIKNFVNMVGDKSSDIKNDIYQKILSLFDNLFFFLNLDFEKEILQLISKVISNTKLLPDLYLSYLLKYLSSINKSQNNNLEYKIENYHIDFIFTCLQCFRLKSLNDCQVKDILINIINLSLLNIPKRVPLKKIMAEHYIYCDFSLCLEFFFFNNLENRNILNLVGIFYQRMEKIPNTDYDLNVKLIYNIILLLIKSDNYDIFDDIFLNKKIMNLYNFICKVISFFPIKDLSLLEHQILSIFCSLMNRYLIIKQKNNQMTQIFTNEENDNDLKDIIYHITSLNLSQLNYIKQMTTIKEKGQSKRNSIDFKDNNSKNSSNNNLKEIVIDSFPKSPLVGCKRKNHGKIIYSERVPHSSLISKNNDYTIDYKANEDDFLISSDIIKYKDENNNENVDSYDENTNPLENNRNGSENNSSENYFYDDGNENNIDDKDEEFLTIKKESKNTFMYYYNKYANEDLIVYLRQINEFNMFELMMKDIEINDQMFYKYLLKKIETSQGIEKVNLIQKFKGFKKISFNNNSNFAYRRLVKINHKK